MSAKSLPFALVSALVFAAPASAEDKPAADVQENYMSTEPLESCVNRWDAGTHMTKEQWLATCKRVSDERGTHLKRQGAVPEPE